MSREGFSPDIRSPPHYQVIFKVSRVFRFLLKFQYFTFKNFDKFALVDVFCCVVT